MQTLPKYESYKDSQIPWLGEIPSHWELKRKKYLFTERVQKGFPAEPLLAATQTQGVVRKTDYDSRTVEATKDFHLLKLVKKGDFVISLRSFEGGIEFAHYQGIISPAYTVLAPLPEVESGFYRYFLKSPQFIQSLKLFVTGIREGQNIDYTKLSRAFLPCPPPDEAKRIASFLDQKAAEIGDAIAKKQRLIELLKEQKAILINQAVTKGLNPGVAMCDSGVEWIGEIPAHWEVKQLKYYSEVQSGITLGKLYSGNKLISAPYLRVANVQDGYFKLDEIAELKLPQKVVDQYFVRVGDILVTEGGDIDKLGRGTVWQGEIENCIHQNHIFAVRVKKAVASEYFVSLVMGADYGRKYFTHTANKTTNLASTNQTKLGNLPIALPPICEQKLIMDYVNDINSRYGAVIATAEKEIFNLYELKQIVVADAVTGKFKI